MSPRVPIPPQPPGIAAFFKFRPETGVPLCQLAEALLRGPSSLSAGERETIAAVVSTKNDCNFCSRSHMAAASAHTGDEAAVASTCANIDNAASPKLRALLSLALKVRESGLSVTDDDVSRAKAAGADDIAIHDTVLIAAAFCMFNRYVDGLAANTPDDVEVYREMGKAMAFQGYLRKRD